jgi:hypothetical protein
VDNAKVWYNGVTRKERTMDYETVNPKLVETDTVDFYVATYRQAYSPERLCALHKATGKPFLVQEAMESYDDFIERATEAAIR